jgi:hypothetical protein
MRDCHELCVYMSFEDYIVLGSNGSNSIFTLEKFSRVPKTTSNAIFSKEMFAFPRSHAVEASIPWCEIG